MGTVILSSMPLDSETTSFPSPQEETEILEMMADADHAVIQAAFLKLSPEDQKLFSYKYNENYSTKQIAGVLGISTNEVRIQLDNAHRVMGFQILKQWEKSKRELFDNQSVPAPVALTAPDPSVVVNSTEEETFILGGADIVLETKEEAQGVKTYPMVNEHTFVENVDRVRSRLMRVAYKIVGPEHAEDAVQSAVMKAWRGLSQFRGTCSFSTWMHRITVNESNMIWRIHHTKLVSHTDSLTVENEEGQFVVVEPTSSSPDQFHTTSSEENRQRVRNAVMRLPPEYRTIVWLRYMEEKSLQEVCEFLTLPMTTVKSRLNYARKLLKNKLQNSEKADQALSLGSAKANGESLSNVSKSVVKTKKEKKIYSTSVVSAPDQPNDIGTQSANVASVIVTSGERKRALNLLTGDQSDIVYYNHEGMGIRDIVRTVMLSEDEVSAELEAACGALASKGFSPEAVRIICYPASVNPQRMPLPFLNTEAVSTLEF